MHRSLKMPICCLALFSAAMSSPAAWASVAEAPATTGNPLWTFLNSSFVVWFLSSVVVAGITAAYARYQKRQTEHTQKTTTQNHLNTEISSRIADALVALRLEQKRIASGAKYWASGMYYEALRYMDNRAADSNGKLLDFSIYPEYQTRRFRSLIVELGAVAEPKMLPALREAQRAYTRIEELADVAPMHEDYSKDPDVEQSLAAIRECCTILEALQAHAFWRSPL